MPPILNTFVPNIFMPNILISVTSILKVFLSILSKKIKPIALYGLTLSLLISCGFHLRGMIQFPEAYQTISITSNNTQMDNRNLAYMIQTRLGSALKIVPDEELADLRVTIDESYRSRALASNAFGENREYSQTYSAQIAVVDREAALVFDRLFQKKKSFTHEESDVLGRAASEAELKKELADDLSLMFVLQLRAALENHPAANQEAK